VCVRVQLDDPVVVPVEAGDLEVRRERGHHERDGVARFEQPIGRQAVEDVTHGRGAALDREDIERHRRSCISTHLGGQVFTHDLLGMHQHPVGSGIVVADDAVGELVHPCVGVEAAFDPVVDNGLQHGDARLRRCHVCPIAEPFCDAGLLGHAGQTGCVPCTPGFAQRKRAEREERFSRFGRDPVRVATPGIE